MHTLLPFFFAGLLFLGGSAMAQSIYSCVDGGGRTITADRPIAECIDRTQRELSRSGQVKRQLGPSLTAHEEAAQEIKQKKEADVRAREIEDRRRGWALLQRYPTRAVHDQERVAALMQIEEIIRISSERRGELVEQGKGIASEFEFYVKDPSRAPEPLKRKQEESLDRMAAQQKLMADQQMEKKRVNQRFDEELGRLKQLWLLTVNP